MPTGLKSAEPRRESRQRGLLLAVGVVALATRILFVMIVPTKPVSDFLAYDNAGWAIASGHGAVDAGQPWINWPPGYPAFLGLLYFIFGHSLLAAKLAQVLLSTATCVLTYFVARAVFAEDGWFIGPLAAMLVAVYPQSIFYTSVLASDVLFSFLLMLAVWTLVRNGFPSSRNALLTGLIIGLATLTRGQALLLPIVVVVWLIIALLKTGGVAFGDEAGEQVTAPRVAFLTWKKTAMTAVLVGLVAIVVVLPWTARNYRVFHRFIPVSANTGTNLWIGNNPAADGRYMWPVGNPLARISDPIERDHEGIRLASAFIRRDPWGFFHRGLRKLTALLAPAFDGTSWSQAGSTNPGGIVLSKAALAEEWSYALLAVPALFGLAAFLWRWILLAWRTRRNGGRPEARRDSQQVGGLLLFGVVLYWMAVHFIFFGDSRYRLPLIPIFAIFAAYAAYAVYALVGAFRDRMTAEA